MGTSSWSTAAERGTPSFCRLGSTADAKVGAPSRDNVDKDGISLKLSASPAAEDDGWSTVLPSRWWCRPEFKNASSSRPTTSAARSHSASIPARLRGKCLRCLAGGHFAATCREPVRCLCCGRFGHKARECRGKETLQVCIALLPLLQRQTCPGHHLRCLNPSASLPSRAQQWRCWETRRRDLWRRRLWRPQPAQWKRSSGASLHLQWSRVCAGTKMTPSRTPSSAVFALSSGCCVLKTILITQS